MGSVSYWGDASRFLAIWSTYPNPCPIISSLCSRIIKTCNLSPPELPVLSAPIPIVPIWSLTPPLPVDFLYVGAGCSLFPLRPSPWMNPFSEKSYDSLCQYVDMVRLRPDHNYFLSFVGKASTLVCDCAFESCCCHARFLSSCMVGQPKSTKSLWFADVQDHEPFVDEGDEAIWLSPQSQYGKSSLCSINETLRGCGLGPGQNVGYLPAWDDLITSVRSSQVLMFWEIFAGSAVLTEKMRDRGWQCAPPLDVLFDESFNLLDPAFVSVVIGLIMEGRFALIHLFRY